MPNQSSLPLSGSPSPIFTRWKAILDSLLKNPLNSASVLKNVQLTTGVNVINHLLGRTQQGWYLTDINGAAVIFRSEPFNNLTLTLTSDADVIVNIGVF